MEQSGFCLTPENKVEEIPLCSEIPVCRMDPVPSSAGVLFRFIAALNNLQKKGISYNLVNRYIYKTLNETMGYHSYEWMILRTSITYNPDNGREKSYREVLHFLNNLDFEWDWRTFWPLVQDLSDL